ncbi:MAG: threonylcarbamoyl-AMP synthase [Chitinivibrionales bacterium]|nr:threonylcarbamoyl-AMP synthase [Chitinivibrionales bacterium]
MAGISTHHIAEAACIIRRGGLVAFPTETVYGLGADACNAAAVAAIFSAKQRPRFDPLIVHIHDFVQIELVAHSLPPKAYKLIEAFWPGPLTIVVPKQKAIPDIVTSGLPQVAVRMPGNSIARELIKQAQTAVAAPSANKFGHISPTRAAHVQESFGSEVDMILDGGPCTVGVESTILGFTADPPVVLRFGGIALEDIKRVVGEVQIPPHNSRVNASPGRQLRHYAPLTPLIAYDSPCHQQAGLRKGLLAFCPPQPAALQQYAAIEVLSERGDPAEAACNLFAALRKLDSKGLDVIVTTPAPDYGLGPAINDRLNRASYTQTAQQKARST